MLRGEDSKLCGLPLCSSRYFGEGGLWGGSGSNLEGLKAASDVGVWKGFGNTSSLGCKEKNKYHTLKIHFLMSLI